MGMFAPGRSETVNYHYWPARFGWSSGPYQQTLWRWVRRAIDSRRWTLDYPHRYTCLSSLEIHRAAARRMWHGWPIGGSSREYGWTLHLGRFKVYFGDPDTTRQSEISTNGPSTPQSEVGKLASCQTDSDSRTGK
jgi:hypothetical protein